MANVRDKLVIHRRTNAKYWILIDIFRDRFSIGQQIHGCIHTIQANHVIFCRICLDILCYFYI